MNKNFETLFKTATNKFPHDNDWFRATKCSINVGKIKLLFFHKQRLCDTIPFRLTVLKFNNVEIKTETSLKFTGVVIDGNINWNKHKELVKNKISKDIGILFPTFTLSCKSKGNVFIVCYSDGELF